MKLSEAVRRGVPEIHLVNDFWYTFDREGVVCEGCLVGAALRGACIKKCDYQELTEENWHVAIEFPYLPQSLGCSAQAGLPDSD